MARRVTDNLAVENARIIFRNFSGRESQFNRAGNRNFCVVIDDKDLAADLAEDGWNVKMTNPNNEEYDSEFYIQCSVNFDNIPPSIWLVTNKNKTKLKEEDMDNLDYADFKNVDLIIRPYNWEVNGKTGVKAYVKTMYITIEEDQFADKYSEEDPF